MEELRRGTNMEESHGDIEHAGPPPGHVERHLPSFAYALIPLGVTLIVMGWVSASGSFLLFLRSATSETTMSVVAALIYASIVTIGGFVASWVMRRWDPPAHHA